MGHIYVIGFMGSGKTTAAQKAGSLLSMPVRDIDQCIEKRYGSIKRIFEEEGVHAFRKYESEVLTQQLTEEKAIVSTGGGVVEMQDNVDHMYYNGTVVYLQASFENISKRLKNDSDRPLWNKDIISQQALYQERIRKYKEAAHETIDTNNRTPENVASLIAMLIKSKA